jgi:hypothetical protein
MVNVGRLAFATRAYHGTNMFVNSVAKGTGIQWELIRVIRVCDDSEIEMKSRRHVTTWAFATRHEHVLSTAREAYKGKDKTLMSP